MKRIISIIYFIALLGGGFTANAFEEGKHYQRLSEESIQKNKLAKALLKEVKAHNQVQVLEFFSYACSWCYKLDLALEAWKAKRPAHVDFQAIPVEFHPVWRLFSKAYYAQIELGILDKTHAALFEAVQTDAIKPLSQEGVINFFVAKGLSKEKITQALNSMHTLRQQADAAEMSQAYGITSVPALVIQGKKGVFLSSVSMAGSEEALFKVVDELIEEEQS